MTDLLNRPHIEICFIPYTIEAIIKNSKISYMDLYKDIKKDKIDIEYLSKRDYEIISTLNRYLNYKVLGIDGNSVTQNELNDVNDAFLNNINMSINMDINDSIRFHVEDSVLFVILNKGFFYFLNTEFVRFKNFFFGICLSNLFNFFTEDIVLKCKLYNQLQKQIIRSHYEN